MAPPSILWSTIGFLGLFATSVLSQTCHPLGDCMNGGECNMNNMNSFCNCNGDYFGVLCQHKNTVRCDNNMDCRNNGDCNRNGVCECDKHWYGPTCETVCPGMPSVCQNGGTCVPDNQEQEGFRCSCNNQLTGKYCENPPKRCASGVCLNGGVPNPFFTENIICVCPSSYGGPCCGETDGPGSAGGCFNQPCLNGGVCTPGGFCDCPTAWVGPQCQDPAPGVPPPLPPGPCDPNPCINGGNCTDVPGTNQFTCQCPTQYTGNTCQGLSCSPNLCMNGGMCMESLTSDTPFYTCTCGPMHTGSNCDTVLPTSSSTDGDQGGGVGQGGGDGQQQNNITTIIIAAVGGVVALIVVISCCVVIFCCCCYRSGMHTSSNKSKRMTAHNAEEARSNNLPLQQNTYIELKERKTMEFPRVNLRLLEHIGSGSFAEVHKAKAYSIIKSQKMATVAVKLLKENASDNDRKDFMKEMALCKMLGRHDNVVNMLGCCTEGEPVYLIMEYLNKGNLQQHLRNLGKEKSDGSYGYLNTVSGNHLKPAELLKFGIDIASGMEFIALKKCVHRDLAARNVLLGRDMRCKISDFGLARDVADSSEYEMKSKSRVPVRWMAPESLMQNMYTTKSDAWSFGIVMWEIITLGSHPYPGMSPRQVMEGVLNGYRLPKPDHCAEEIYSKVEHCWEHDPDKRPFFTEIKKDLEEIMEIDQGYLQMDNFNQSDYVYLEPDAEAEEEL